MLSNENNSNESEPVETAPAESPTTAQSAATGVIDGNVGTETAQVWISAFLIAALGFVVYLSAFSIPLHGDDLTLFGGGAPISRLVTCLESLPQMPYAPLTVVGLSLNAVIGGGNIDFLHGGGIFLHLLCAVLVFLLARRLLPAGAPEAVAMIAGMLFAVHPLASEPVVSLAARSVVQSAFFGLLGVVLLLRGCVPLRHSFLSITASVTCFVLAFGSDISALCFPLIGVALLYYRGNNGSGSNDFRGAVASVLLLVTAMLATVGLAGGLLTSTIQGPLLDRALALPTQAGFLLYYGLLPQSYSLLPVTGGLLLGSVALLVLGAVILTGFLNKKLRLPAILGIWILLTIVGTSFFAPMEEVGPTRYLYVPWMAVCILAPWLVQSLRLPRARAIGSGLLAVIVLALGMVTFNRCGLWVRPATLWAAEAEAHPDALAPRLALARFLVTQQNSLQDENAQSQTASEAIAAWTTVLDVDPENAEARENLGMLTMGKGEYELALNHLHIAEARLPQNQTVALYVAYAAEQQARATADQNYIVEAIRALERAQRLGPLPAPAQERYGILVAQMGNFSLGVKLLEQAAQGGRGEALTPMLEQFRGLADQATALAAQADDARSHAPRGAAVLLLQAQRSLLEGRQLDAFYLLQMVIAQEPTNPIAWTLLGYVSGRLDGVDNFIAEWGTVRSGDLEAWKQLALRCGAGGIWQAAETYLRYGVEGLATDKPLPELLLADIAEELKQSERAVAYVQAASTAYPESPVPWLRLADMAIATGDNTRVRGLLDEAVKRNADPAMVKERADKVVGERPAVREGITRTVIR